MEVRPHVHEPLTGQIVSGGKKIFKTRLAQVYPEVLCARWAQCFRGHRGDPLELTFNWVQPAEDRKRPLGQEVPWSGHKQKISAEKAVAAGYQLKRSALPPLLKVEMDPGQAVKVALTLDHPFSASSSTVKEAAGEIKLALGLIKRGMRRGGATSAEVRSILHHNAQGRRQLLRLQRPGQMDAEIFQIPALAHAKRACKKDAAYTKLVDR